MNTSNATMIKNVTYDALTIGQSDHLQRTLTGDDIRAFAAVSGDTNPAHLDPEYAANTVFHGVIAHGMWGAALISALLGTKFPGPGTIYLEQNLQFTNPVHIGDTLTVSATVLSKDDAHRRVVLDCQVCNQNAVVVVHGNAVVVAPAIKIFRPAIAAPTIHLVDT